MNHTHTNETVTELTEAYVLCSYRFMSIHFSFLCGHCVNSQFLRPVNYFCRFNKENIFAEGALDMGFVVREPIINATFGDIRFRR